MRELCKYTLVLLLVMAARSAWAQDAVETEELDPSISVSGVLECTGEGVLVMVEAPAGSSVEWSVSDGSEFATINNYGEVSLLEGVPYGEFVTIHMLMEISSGPYQGVYEDETDIELYCTPEEEDCDDCTDCNAAGGGSASVGSVVFSANLGYGLGAKRAGNLVIRSETITANLATPAGLEFARGSADPSQVEIIRVSGAIRQALAPEVLADVVALNGSEYLISFYYASQVGAKLPSGLYPVTGSPYVQWRIQDPDAQPASINKLRIQKETPQSILRHWQFEYSVLPTFPQTVVWRLENGDGTTAIRESFLEVQGGVKRRYVRANSSSPEAYRRHDTFSDFGWGPVLTQSVLDPFGENLATTYDYYQGGVQLGRTKSVQNSDGSWVWYDYDSFGRTIVQARPLGDMAFSDPPNLNACHVIEHDFNSIEPAFDDLSNLPWAPRTITTKFAGQVTAKRFLGYLRDGNGALQEYRFDAVDPSANYLTSTNLLRIRTFQVGDDDELASEYFPDGRVDIRTAETGTYAPGTPGTFTPGAGADLRRIVFHMGRQLPTDPPALIPNKSMVDVEILDLFGTVVQEEQHIFDGAAFNRVSWTVTSVDQLGRIETKTLSNGMQKSTTWSQCCGEELSVNEHGVATQYIPDGIGRREFEITAGVPAFGSHPAQASRVTQNQFDAYDRKTVEVHSAGALQTSRSIEYHASGRIKRTIDEDQRQTDFAYASTGQGGRRVTTTTPGGGTIVREFFRDGRLKSVSGNAVVNEYYAYGTNPDGSSWTAVTKGNSTSGRTFKTTKNMIGQSVEIRKPGFGGQTHEVVEAYSYEHGTGRLVAKDSSAAAGGVHDGTMLFGYDELSRNIRVAIDVDGNGIIDLGGIDRVSESHALVLFDSGSWWLTETQMIYPEFADATPLVTGTTRTRLTGFSGNTVSEVQVDDERGNTTTTLLEIDRVNALTTTTTDAVDSDTDSVSIVRNQLKQSETTEIGKVTTYLHDDLGRLSTTIYPRIGPESRSYGAGNLLSSLTTASGETTFFGYEAGSKRLSWIKDPNNNYSYYSYNHLGQTTRLWGDVAQPVEVVFDEFMQQTEIRTFRAGSNWNSPTWPTTTGTVDITIQGFDSATGLLTSRIFANGLGETYDYYSDGRIKTRTSARMVGGQPLKTTYSHTPTTGELSMVDYSDSTPDVGLSYNRLGSLDTVVDGLGTRTVSYDGLDLSNERLLASGILPREYNVSYLFEGNTEPVPGRYKAIQVGSLADPDADYLSSMTYDSRGRTERVTGPGLPAYGAEYSYVNGRGIVAGIQFKSTSTTTVADVDMLFDPVRNLIQEIDNDWGSTTISNYAYEFNNTDRRESVVRTGSAFGVNTFDRFQYDSRLQLSDVDTYFGTNPSDLSSPVPNGNLDYSFDNAGNRTSSASGSSGTTYNRNSVNQYTSTTGPSESFSYDNDGNMTGDSAKIYTWDAENRLASVAPASVVTGSKRVFFTYDYLGRRVRERVEAWNGAAWNTQADEFWIYAGERPLVKVDSAGTVQHRYTWGLQIESNGVGGLLAMQRFSADGDVADGDGVGEEGDYPAPVPVPVKNYVFFYDAQGNVTQAMDVSSGAIAASIEYDEYGNSIAFAGDLSLMPFRYTTKYHSDAAGLYDFGARWYSSRLGRWLSRDPARELGGPNLYTANYNDPANYLDPDGRHPAIFYIWTMVKGALKLRAVGAGIGLGAGLAMGGGGDGVTDAQVREILDNASWGDIIGLEALGAAANAFNKGGGAKGKRDPNAKRMPPCKNSTPSESYTWKSWNSLGTNKSTFKLKAQASCNGCDIISLKLTATMSGEGVWGHAMVVMIRSVQIGPTAHFTPKKCDCCVEPAQIFVTIQFSRLSWDLPNSYSTGAATFYFCADGQSDKELE